MSDVTERFSARAEAYTVGRPSYPMQALDALFIGLGEPASLVVLDLGAGTGISSRAIASCGPRVIALEPNAAMRAKDPGHPRISWLAGTAERTTLPDHSVDLAAAFQAWHWFDHAATLAEMRRVVRPGGRIAVLYNERDERDPFTAALGDIFRAYATEPIEELRARTLETFAGLPTAQRATFANAQDLDRAGLHARLESSSYVPHEGTAWNAMHADVDALFDRYAEHERVRICLATYLVISDV